MTPRRPLTAFILALCFAGSVAAAPTLESLANAAVTVSAQDAKGATLASSSGVVIGKGRVMTNCHDPILADVLQVTHGGRAMTAKPWLKDPVRSLCVLVVEGLTAPGASIRKASTLAVGEPVYAVGNPRGTGLVLSSGILSALAPDVGSSAILVTTAAIAPGSSGGALFDAEGRLIGITLSVLGNSTDLTVAYAADAIAAVLAQGNSFERRTDTATAEPDWIAEMEALRLKQAWPALERLARRYLDVHPEGTYAWGLLGLAVGNQNRLSEARSAYDRALALDPRDPVALSYRGQIRAMSEDLDGAEADVRAALRHGPDSGYAYAVLADILDKRGKRREQLAAATRATELDPVRADFWSRLATAHTRLNQTEAAGRARQIAARLDPSQAVALASSTASGKEAPRREPDATRPSDADAVTWTGAGQQALREKRMAEAEAHFRKASRADPASAAAAAGLATVLLATGRVDEAERVVVDALSRLPKDAALLMSLGRVHGARAQWDRAERAYESAVKVSPVPGIDLWRELGIVRFRGDRMAKAADAFARVTASDGASANDWELLCAAQVAAGSGRAATAACEKALSLSPRSESNLIHLARIAGDGGDHAKALAYLDRALQANGKSHQAMSGKGYALLKLGRRDEAFDVLSTAVRLDPTVANAWINLGRAQFEAGRTGPAAASLERAVDLAPRAADARELLAQSYLANRQPRRALEQADELRRIAPGSTAALTMGTLAALASGDRVRATADYEALKRVDPAKAADVRRQALRLDASAGALLPH